MNNDRKENGLNWMEGKRKKRTKKKKRKRKNDETQLPSNELMQKSEQEMAQAAGLLLLVKRQLCIAHQHKCFQQERCSTHPICTMLRRLKSTLTSAGASEHFRWLLSCSLVLLHSCGDVSEHVNGQTRCCFLLPRVVSSELARRVNVLLLLRLRVSA